MKVVVTGGAGFIGTAVVRRFLAEGHEVSVFDNLCTGARGNVAPEASFHFGDIRNFDEVAAAVRGVDVVVHLAAFVSVAQSFVEPKLCWDVNVMGTRNVLEAAWRGRAGRLVLASTAAVYGNEAQVPTAETAPICPQSPYALSKWQSELDARYYGDYLSIETSCLRFFNVYGPLQRPDSPYSGVISIASRKVLKNDVFTIYGSGEQTRDFIFVEDVAGAIATAASTAATEHDTFNIGTGNRTSVSQLIQLIGELTGVTPKIVHSSPRKGDILHSVADNCRMSEDLRFKPQVALAEGIGRTLAWMNSTETSRS